MTGNTLTAASAYVSGVFSNVYDGDLRIRDSASVSGNSPASIEVANIAPDFSGDGSIEVNTTGHVGNVFSYENTVTVADGEVDSVDLERVFSDDPVLQVSGGHVDAVYGQADVTVSGGTVDFVDGGADDPDIIVGAASLTITGGYVVAAEFEVSDAPIDISGGTIDTAASYYFTMTDGEAGDVTSLIADITGGEVDSLGPYDAPFATESFTIGGTARVHQLQRHGNCLVIVEDDAIVDVIDSDLDPDVNPGDTLIAIGINAYVDVINDYNCVDGTVLFTNPASVGTYNDFGGDCPALVERRFEQPHDRGDRDPDPVGAVVELVAQLVDRLLELEDREQLGDRRLARGQQRCGRPSPCSRLEEALARGRLPALGRWRRRPRTPTPRRRTSAACPATSRSGERLRRRSGSERAGSPSKSRITQPSAVSSIWPRW